MGIVKDIKNLVMGLGIAGKHLGRHAITIQYPEEKWTMPECSRGIVVLLSDQETGALNCTACELCARACPSAAIKVIFHKEEKKKILDDFVVDNTLCCFCGLCEESCNFSAIKLCPKYEFSTIDKDDLIWHKDKLQEIGLDVPFVDVRKAKKAAAAKKKAEAEAKAAAEANSADGEVKPESTGDEKQTPPAPPTTESTPMDNEKQAPSAPSTTETTTDDNKNQAPPAPPVDDDDKKTEGGDS